MKKLISICIPCRDEVDNVKPLSEELIKYLECFDQYDFEIIFSDNCSTDGTQDRLREICSHDKRVKAILNAKNFPQSLKNAIYQAKGNCVITMYADFQIPLETVPRMIREWEKGAVVVALKKIPSTHDKFRFFRILYYAISKKFANQQAFIGTSALGLYDRKIINLCKNTRDPFVNLPTMAALYAEPLVVMPFYEQPRRSGKSKNNFFSLFQFAILRLTRTSDKLPRYSIYMSLIIGIFSFFISIYYLIRKLLNWHNFPLGTAPLLIGMFFFGAIQLFFLGIIGEYVLLINERQKNRPLVVEKERLNFDDEMTNNEE